MKNTGESNSQRPNRKLTRIHSRPYPKGGTALSIIVANGQPFVSYSNSIVNAVGVYNAVTIIIKNSPDIVTACRMV